MNDKEIDLFEKMQYLKEKTLHEIRANLISERIKDKISVVKNLESINREDIETEVDEIMQNITIEVKFLGNPEKQEEGFFEVIINQDETLNYIYYDSDLEEVAEKRGIELIELTEKYRDRKDLLQRIEKLREEDELSLEEVEKVRKLAEENEIDIDGMEEIDLSQGIEEDEQEKSEEETEQEISATKQEELSGYVKQEMDTNQIIDGRESLAKRLGLEEYSKIYVIYSDKVDQVQNEDGKTNKRNNTKFSLIGVRKDGTAKVLNGENGEFEIDRSSGINPNDEHIRQNDDDTIEKNNDIVTRYKRTGSEESLAISQEEQGQIRAYFETGRTKEKNTAVGTEIETSQTKREYEDGIRVQTRKIMSKEHGIYNNDRIQDEVEEELKTDKDGILESEQADGNNNITTEYLDIYIDNAVEELMKDEDIEQLLQEKK